MLAGAVAVAGQPEAAPVTTGAMPPDTGYRQKYNLDFDGATKLRLTAENGHYLAPFARLLLAVTALRENHRGAARTILVSLSHEFPSSRLSQKELARIR